MVIIFSESVDITTNRIIDYFINSSVEFMRVNENDVFDVFFNNNKVILILKNINLKLEDIKSTWFRRTKLQLSNLVTNNIELDNYFFEQSFVIENYLNYKLQKKALGNFQLMYVNKLVINSIAKSIGFNVPKSEISSFLPVSLGNSVITKPINGSPTVKLNEKVYLNLLTKQIDFERYSEFNFLNSYFQEKIEKKYELRVFYLINKCYTMAIFSQNNPKTNIDFRNYDDLKPNRCIPYILSEKLENKIHKFMKKINLNCGSLDFIVDTNNKIFFLEVNPVGQFGYLSDQCNYNLEYEIANLLINNFKNNNNE